MCDIEDIWYHILQYCSAESIVSILRLSRFHYLLDTEYLWKNVLGYHRGNRKVLKYSVDIPRIYRVRDDFPWYKRYYIYLREVDYTNRYICKCDSWICTENKKERIRVLTKEFIISKISCYPRVYFSSSPSRILLLNNMELLDFDWICKFLRNIGYKYQFVSLRLNKIDSINTDVCYHDFIRALDVSNNYITKLPKTIRVKKNTGIEFCRRIPPVAFMLFNCEPQMKLQLIITGNDIIKHTNSNKYTEIPIYYPPKNSHKKHIPKKQYNRGRHGGKGGYIRRGTFL